MKKNISTIIIILIFIVGVFLLLYPFASNSLYSHSSSKTITKYTDEVLNLQGDRYEQIRDAAQKYNADLVKNPLPYFLDEEQTAAYDAQLNVSGTGVMGYVVIDAIEVVLPIYHGAGDESMKSGVGHLEWSSLPVGGKSTHSVLSGHSGLPSAKLFTDLEELGIGDTFELRILNDVLAYEIDQILVVEPDDTENLQIVKGKDFCTLMTCTPYGVNSHRLLVRGSRIGIGRAEDAAKLISDAAEVETGLAALFIAVPVLLLVFFILMIPKRR